MSTCDASIAEANPKGGDLAKTQAMIIAGGNTYGTLTKSAEGIIFKPTASHCQISQLPEVVAGNVLVIVDGPKYKKVSQLHKYDFILSNHCMRYF